MAKAQFHKGQKVWVKPVGTWAMIEGVNPVWAKGFDEPVRITYDCALGREFMAHELMAETPKSPGLLPNLGSWRMMRGRNKWQSPEECRHHPYPGTYPVVVTDPNDWGGWRVPGAEYDLAPEKIETQARLISNAPELLNLAAALCAHVRGELNASNELIGLARQGSDLIKQVMGEAQSEPAQILTTETGPIRVEV